MKTFNIKLTVPNKKPSKADHVLEATTSGSNVEAAVGKALRELMVTYMKDVVKRRPSKMTLSIEEVLSE